MNLPQITFNLSLASALLLLGCLGPRQSGEERPAVDDGLPGSDSAVVDSRGFDPLELNADLDVIPSGHKIKAEIRGQVEPPRSDTSGGVIAPTAMEGVPDEIDTLNSQAYRIQIFTSKLYGEARKAMHVAEEIFDRPVFVDYEVPNFKVRVGNFVEREDAEEYEQRVKAAGYNTAWVVMVTVNVKQTDSLYENFLIDQFEKRDSSAAEDDIGGR